MTPEQIQKAAEEIALATIDGSLHAPAIAAIIQRHAPAPAGELFMQKGVPEAEPSRRKVGCEREDGLLNIHLESETCEVCASEPTTPGEKA